MTEPLHVSGGWVQGAQLRLRVYRADRSGRTGGPIVIVLPGLDRTIAALAAWIGTVSGAFETLLVDLPGQGESQTPATISVESLVAELRAAVAGATDLPVILVGESLGGLAALAIAADPPANVVAVMAVDPPLSPTTQPHLVAGVRRVLAQHSDNPFLFALSKAVLGIGPAGELPVRRSHLPLVMAATAPTLLLTGDIHIGDTRAIDLFARTIDGAELDHIRRAAPQNVTVRVIPGAGHAVLTDRPEAALEALKQFVAPLIGS